MDGVLVIDKPSGWTSHDVVAKIRNLTKVKKVGHAGTLDPFATGVLPLTLGRATRLTNRFLSSDKVYRGVMRFGFATTTYDLDGTALGEDCKPQLERTRIEEILSHFVGAIHQTLPPFSAKKVQGRPLYSYARQGLAMAPATKEVTIKSIRLVQVEGSEVEFELTCAAGTYARSLAHDAGKEYGCGAHLIRLCRTQSGEFSLGEATPLLNGTDFFSSEHFLGRAIPLRNLLQDIPAIVISAGDRSKVIHGIDLNLLTANWESAEYRLIDEAGDVIALAQRLQTFTSPVAQPAHWIRIHPHLTFV
jgi:tRNA pseudouridine55 synthase